MMIEIGGNLASLIGALAMFGFFGFIVWRMTR
jgi:hypothetical protein